MTAFEIQVAADRKHHAERIDWLTAPRTPATLKQPPRISEHSRPIVRAQFSILRSLEQWTTKHKMK